MIAAKGFKRLQADVGKLRDYCLLKTLPVFMAAQQKLAELLALFPPIFHEWVKQVGNQEECKLLEGITDYKQQHRDPLPVEVGVIAFGTEQVAGLVLGNGGQYVKHKVEY